MNARPDNRTQGDLARQRARMDRLNLRLRDLLQQRARLAIDIACWKAARGLPVADPARERAMLAAMLESPGPGFERPALQRLLRAILRESRAAAVVEARRRVARSRARAVRVPPGSAAAPRPRRRRTS
jgi:chorismate mutase